MRSTNPFLFHSMESAVNYLALDTQCIKYPHAEHSHIIEIVYSVLCAMLDGYLRSLNVLRFRDDNNKC